MGENVLWDDVGGGGHRSPPRLGGGVGRDDAVGELFGGACDYDSDNPFERKRGLQLRTSHYAPAAAGDTVHAELHRKSSGPRTNGRALRLVHEQERLDELESVGKGALEAAEFDPLYGNERLSAWRDIGASRQTLRWLGEGVRVPWNERGPPLPFHHGVGSFSPNERAWLTQERDRCLGTGAWRRATRCDYVSRAFVVWHKGKPRLVIDLRWVNEHVEKRSCKFESLATLRRLARRHDFMFSLDLTDAYHHIGVHESDVDYFTFAVMRDVVRYLRNPDAAARPRYGQRRRHSGVHRGVRTLPWLDDFAFFVRGVRADHPEYGAMLEAARAESMRVAPSERTTTGLGCFPGREPSVRVADPEAAGPAHPQRGHGQGQA
ncbi:hypothetical protein EMIHUDRAFT_210232 [Emiliania huxleyi CCMP1516]|uniref:Reverse transcriptase domain-containing protein n=2 Tax=Emiliania huxleyi TaxID=2903 RepID=A0A0D3J1V1_EMIH1|nr:hypothetical protein EMIHUDRAFT_210232 [Emiliania huxleyi CCMP1516]EOD17486.1 hypothetical protein EMIHUDRAFT_210232 [Emiliania huxleyi CCMP1516]|eukprot:XP_005769915.1 hypothetical protein EMIHUDRAFT_210232 [Emiliania huxleyi CCMP1516]